MSNQFSVAVRNAMLDAIEATIGTGAIFELRSGSPPANCAAADSGTVIATITAVSDWMAAAALGSKAKSGALQDTSADNPGTLGHFRVKDSGGTVCGWQGTITATGGGGDMTVDNVSVAAGQQITITALSLTAGNA